MAERQPPPEETRWKPGQSGNPGGRSRVLEKYIRDETKQGKELADLMLGIVRGKGKGFTVANKIEAAKWLADRGWGRPAQELQHTGADGTAVIRLYLPTNGRE